jgi:hypothetical protein
MNIDIIISGEIIIDFLMGMILIHYCMQNPRWMLVDFDQTIIILAIFSEEILNHGI